MKLINKRVFRAFGRARVRTAAIVLALALAMTMGSGVSMGLRSVLETRDHATTRLGLADLEVRLLPEDVRNLPDWTSIPGLASVERRLLLPGTMKRKDGRALSALLIFLEKPQPTINRLELRSGRFFETDLTEGVAERSLPEFHDIGVGATVNVQVGRQVYDLRLVGTAASAEFLIVAAHPEYFLPEKASLGIIYAPIARVYEQLGFTMVNDLIFTFATGHDPTIVKERILSALGNRTVERVIPKQDHLSYRHMQTDFGVFSLFAPSIEIVLLILALVLVVINVDRLVRQEQREIGALKALGYDSTTVVWSYVLGVSVLAVVGILLGTLGALGLQNAFLDMYVEGHGLAEVLRNPHPRTLVQTAIVVFVMAGFSALVGTRALWRKRPMELLRPAAEGLGQRPGLLRKFLLWLRIRNLPLRLGVRNLSRSPRLFVATVLGMSATVAVAVAYFICLESMGVAIEGSFSRQGWTRAVSFLYPVLDEEYTRISTLPGVTRIEPFVRTHGRVSRQGSAVDVSLLAVAGDGQLARFNLTSGRLASGHGEVVLGEDVRRKLATQVGEKIQLNLRNRVLELTVAGVKSDVLLNEIVLTLAFAQEILELENQATGVFLATAAELNSLDTALARLDFLGRSSTRDTLAGEFKEILDDIRSLVLLVAVIAMLLAAVFIIANLVMTTTERKGEFATLWALGAGASLRSRIIRTEAFVQTIAALILAVPLTVLTAEVLNGLASRAWFNQPTSYSASLVVTSVVAILGLTGLAVWPASRAARGSDLLGQIRTRSIQ